MTDPDIRAAARADLEARMAGKTYVPLLPGRPHRTAGSARLAAQDRAGRFRLLRRDLTGLFLGASGRGGFDLGGDAVDDAGQKPLVLAFGHDADQGFGA
jgi:hypothetical protein